MSHSKVLLKKKKKNQPDLLQDLQQFLESGLDIFISVYMLLIMVVMPFYFTDGYARIGSNKYEFFYSATTKVGIIIVPLFGAYLVVRLVGYLKRKKAEGKQVWRDLFSCTDWFALGYALVVCLSYMCSDYKVDTVYGNAWKGTTGWYMGLVSQLFFVAIYFAISRFWKCRKWMLALWIPVTLVVFVLGYLNRFDIRPIEMKNATVEFISTIGNINWYCGYMVIIFFGVLYYIWAEIAKKPWVQMLLYVWLTIGFATLLTQGSLSGILAMGVLLIMLYLYSMKDGKKLLRFWSCLLCMGVACLGTYLLRSYFEEAYNYEDTVSRIITFSPVTLVIFAVTVLGCFGTLFLQRKNKVPVDAFTLLGYVGCGVVALGVVGFIVLGIINTLNPGSIGVLSEISALTFDYEWGSLRGATWAAGWMCFYDQDWIGKLLGVGPDCMAMYIHSGENKELLAIVEEYFNSLTLTNAHCEWFTILVNTGLLGMLSYAGMMISAMIRFLKARIALPIVGACGFGILAYTVNNMVSFQQSMSTVTVFLVLGIGEAYLKTYSEK